MTTIQDIYGTEILPSIDTMEMLKEFFDIHPLQTAFDKWAENEENANRYTSHFEDVENFLEAIGYEEQARDNTYNNENDLSMDYVWGVYVPSGVDVPDWIYQEDYTLTVIIPQTYGGDPRGAGNYGKPMFLRSNGDYSIPVDLVAGFYLEDSDGNNADDEGRFSQGYSSAPWCELEKHTERVFEWTRTENSVCAIVDGQAVRVSTYYYCGS